MRAELELRNVPQFRVMEYLMQAGGTLTGDRSAAGEGWSAVLVELEPVMLRPHTQIPRDMLVIDGENETETERVIAFMRRKTMRGGG